MKRALIIIAILLILIVPASAMQIWYLSSNTIQDGVYIMYKGSLPTHSGKKTVTITKKAIWVANESAKVNVTFPETEWTLVLFAKTKGKDSGKIRISIGVWNGNSFESYGNTTLTLSNDLQSCTISTSSFTVPKGCRLALQIECIEGTIELHVKKDKEFSNLVYPSDAPPYPVSELLPVVLVSVGLALMAMHRNVR